MKSSCRKKNAKKGVIAQENGLRVGNYQKLALKIPLHNKL